MTIQELANKYGTDKSDAVHGYGTRYDKYFERFKNRDINILEIGVAEGKSLSVWQEYFTPNSNIVGIDIRPFCKQYERDNINVFIGDQTDENFLKDLNSKYNFDIIVDDGSHVDVHQIKSFEILFPMLKEDGIYAIEDIHAAYHPHYNKGDMRVTDYLKTIVDDINFNGKHFKQGVDMLGSKKNQYNALINKELTYVEEYVASIHFYMSMCFIEKDKGLRNG